MEAKAREYLNDPSKSTQGCILVTLYLDGKLVTVCINEDDETVNEAFDEFTDPGFDDYISIEDLFDGDEDGGGGNGNPTSTPSDLTEYFDQPSPTPTFSFTPPPENDDGDNPPIKAECLSWEEDIVGSRAIISNTLCSIQRIEEE